jgi:ADP-heptose:LPS heptosyltransferase
MVGKPSKPIIEMSGTANAVIGVDRVALRDGSKLVSIGRIIKLVRDVRKSKFDLIVDLHSYAETNLLGLYQAHHIACILTVQTDPSITWETLSLARLGRIYPDTPWIDISTCCNH